MEEDNNLVEEDSDERREYERRRAKRRLERRRKKRQEVIFRSLLVLAILTLLIIAGFKLKQVWDQNKTVQAGKGIPKITKVVENQPDSDVQLLDVNEYSRPGQSLDKVKGIVIHYTANPGTTAQQNRNYFQGLKDSKDTYASSHFVVGIEGEIIQCIPCNEISYASNDRNADTIAIECCIPDETGEFSKATYQSLVHLTAWLVGRYDLSSKDVIRHYDVTEKMCPKYYVEHEDAWNRFKSDVDTYIKTNGVERTEGGEASE